MKAQPVRINETRGLLSEYGIIVPQGTAIFRTYVLEELAALEARVAIYDAQLSQVARMPLAC